MLVKQKGYSKKHREMVKRIVINYMFKKGELKVHKLKKAQKSFVLFAKK